MTVRPSFSAQLGDATMLSEDLLMAKVIYMLAKPKKDKKRQALT
jgi:hypothetical protein